MPDPLDAAAQRQVFLDAHSTLKFNDTPLGDDLLHKLYDLCKWGPTAMNSQPMRLVFVRSPEGKQRLAQALNPGNVEKTMSAPATAIVALDNAFHEQLPTQMPAIPGARDLFAGNAALRDETAFRNSSLQGGYLIVAAHMLGLATGPMSGFDARRLDQLFFPDGRWRSNFLVNIGHPLKEGGHHPRGPRLGFDIAARFA